jgi:hypothetical protein
MDKLSTFVSTVKESDVWETSGSDKVVKCLAVIGAVATVKSLWNPFRHYVVDRITNKDR